ncbi:hypothetical protein [Chryseobacterium sp. Mn2064]|uniref:hypothetical protein n=1 Tax=Chryseobacterium sp. Mn2064 TaxID=3395263 RepID=UPI003BBE207D
MNKAIFLVATLLMIFCGYVKGQTTIGQLTKEYTLKSKSFTESGSLVKSNITPSWDYYTLGNILKSPDNLKLTFQSERSYELVLGVDQATSIRKFEKLLHIPTTYFETDLDLEQALKLKSKNGALKGAIQLMQCRDQFNVPSQDFGFALKIFN